MVNDFDLIHMGGRTYNPVLGRFMQADPFIQAGANLQNYNRYSYVLNNPMSYTDPSGYFFRQMKGLSRGISRILGSRWSQVMVTMASTGCGWMAPACFAVGTYQVQRAHGASSTGALRTSVIAGFMRQVTPAAGAAGESTRSHLERLGDELMNRAYQRAMEGVLRAAQGGTSSHATSGKFANAATTGSYSQMLNGMSDSIQPSKEAVTRNQRIVDKIRITELESGLVTIDLALIVKDFTTLDEEVKAYFKKVASDWNGEYSHNGYTIKVNFQFEVVPQLAFGVVQDLDFRRCGSLCDEMKLGSATDSAI